MDPALQAIVIATDGSASAREAEGVAAHLARQANAALHLVHVGPVSGDSTVLQQAGDRVGAIETAVAGHHLRHGHPADQIIAVAVTVGAQLIVIGTHGRSAVGRLILGSVAVGVAHAAVCPTLVVHHTPGTWPPTRIVNGDDGSPTAWDAATQAATLGGLCGADILAVDGAFSGAWRDGQRDGRAA